MAAIPYMPLYVADYLADSAHLSTVEHGAYLLLIMTYWQRGEALPDDDKKLARICRIGPREWARMKPVISEFFQISRGAWFHSRIESELDNVRSKSLKKREGGLARAKQMHSTRLAPAQLSDTDTDTEDTTDVVSRDAGARAAGNADGKPPKSEPPAQQKAPVIPDWIPTESWDGFVAMRKSTKNPLSDHGVKLAIRELEKLRRDGHDPGAVLDQSTLQNWRGLFPIKDNHRGNQNGTATPRTGTGQQLGPDGIGNQWLKACVAGSNGGPDGAGPGSDGGYQDFAGSDWP